jgi:hypothetical protein
LGEKDASIDVWLMFTNKDRVGTRAKDKREFPFDTSVTDKELYVKAYGKTMKDA